MTSSTHDFASLGRKIAEIPVHINYDIIRLFSEGLYRSPSKAIEELVSNCYDAGANHVHILLPETPDDPGRDQPLWVIDDGAGLDEQGFHVLWRIAESPKTSSDSLNGRSPIGQFGIGKLAAYVLAWQLTHVSRSKDRLLLTTMDFRRVTGRQTNAKPIPISLREIDEPTARRHLKSIKNADPEMWNRMFGAKHQRVTSWTAAGLSDFKDLYSKLKIGRLRWVLSTGLPLYSDFKIWLNSQSITASKQGLPVLHSQQVDESVPGIGPVSGRATIFKKPLTTGKSRHVGRSHGFFVRVRGRVINLDDPLFGIPQPNHAAWSRFSMEVKADGLQQHLLSSREGVRDSSVVGDVRKILQGCFNSCRQRFDDWTRKQNDNIELESLMQPPTRVVEPLLHSVRSALESDRESFYVNSVRDVAPVDKTKWLRDFNESISREMFRDVVTKEFGPHAPAVRYDPSNHTLFINLEHPFVDKLSNGGKKRIPAKLFASAELLLEGQLHDYGVDGSSVADFLWNRDRMLRFIAGDHPPTAATVLRHLEIANHDHHALEVATGAAFRILGFEYDKRGGHTHGPDGVLYARLGRHDKPEDYTLVYDTKQTAGPSVPANRLDVAKLELFRNQENADYGFFVADKYMGEEKEDGRVNQLMADSRYSKVSMIKIDHLKRLVGLHYQYGLTLTEIRKLFENARSVIEMSKAIDSLAQDVSEDAEVPVGTILRELEKWKNDPGAKPNILVVRANNPEMKKFDGRRLVSRMEAVEKIIGTRWIEVERSGEVKLHSTCDDILDELERNITELDRISGDE